MLRSTDHDDYEWPCKWCPAEFHTFKALYYHHQENCPVEADTGGTDDEWPERDKAIH